MQHGATILIAEIPVLYSLKHMARVPMANKQTMEGKHVNAVSCTCVDDNINEQPL